MIDCIWKVKKADHRHCEFCTYPGPCPRRFELGSAPEHESKFEEYRQKMNEIIGADIMDHHRYSELVWGRYIVGYQLRMEGYRYKTIAEWLGIHHATVINGVLSVNLMLCSPYAYPIEREMYDKFQQSIKS